MYWWEGEIALDSEVMILMESIMQNFDKTEAEIAKIHDYDTFVLQMIEVSRINEKALNWLKENLG